MVKMSPTIEILIVAATALACVYSKTVGVVPPDASSINVPVAKQCLKDNGLNEGILDVIIKKDLEESQNLNLTEEDRVCSYACHAKYQLDKFVSQIPEDVKDRFTKGEKSELLDIHVGCKTKETKYCKYAVCLYKKYLTLNQELREKISSILDPVSL